ncbi:hypothetical protein GF358_00375 [Candidatus Woesearchaeota archaeon]|nr:hypothetical protein [Candidatus Woesearchaeota archaeon]
MRILKNFRKKFREFDTIADIGQIGRRVFAKNSFDGILTIMGVIMGSYFANITESRTIITTGFGACIAMGVSGIWGTYFTEKAERKKELLELEKVTLRNLSNTKIEKAADFATMVISIIDGLSPFLASLFVLTPFFFISSNINLAYIISLLLAFIVLGILGAFLGKISEQKMVQSSIRMIFAGIACIILSLFLQTF